LAFFFKALANALDQEDDLACQLEQEQEEVLESVIESEQSYLKELEEEKRTEIVIDDAETETESDLGVSCLLGM